MDLEEDNHGYSSYNSYTGQYDPGFSSQRGLTTRPSTAVGIVGNTQTLHTLATYRRLVIRYTG